MSRHVGRSHDTEGRPRDPRPQDRRFKQLRMWRDKREDDRETDAGGGGGHGAGGPERKTQKREGERSRRLFSRAPGRDDPGPGRGEKPQPSPHCPRPELRGG